MFRTALTAAVLALAGLATSAQASDVTFTFQQAPVAVPLSPWTLAAIVLALGAVAMFTLRRKAASSGGGVAFGLMLTLAAGATMSAGAVEARQFVSGRPLVANTALPLNAGSNDFVNVTGAPITLATVTVNFTANEGRFPGGPNDCVPGLQVLPNTSCRINIVNFAS